MGRTIKLFAPLALLVLIFLVASVVIASGEKDTNDEFANTLTNESTIKEQLQWKKDFTEWAQQKGRIQYVSGEETKGSVIEIAGERVQLPENVYVKAFVVAAQSVGNNNSSTPHLPWYAIQNGDSIIVISQKTGFVLNVELTPDAKEPFHFLKGNIKGYLEGVKKYE
ncbi:hypothetical protein [Paenibacillus koleovorans]|uniref:hypothetical protein n=1 Tax=Paenibacillus koleovorans TaxID=121608 RepID=UPI000FD802AE|nr:hypothetical protein [Paenibacillus koleovorans]